jgi:hypothetical protein
MTGITVAPNLVLDDDMYDLARAALSMHAPDEVEGFTGEQFFARESWVLVPDPEHPEVPWYKAELVIKNRAPWDQTLKLNVWWSPDLRKSGEPLPHSHPWPFTGHVLLGGYTEDRYEVADPGSLLVDPHSFGEVGLANIAQGVEHRAGQGNEIDLVTFHEVTAIHEPGRTISLMNCGLGRKDGWGYLDPSTGTYTPNKQSPTDPRFKTLLLDRNPHLR